MLSVDELAQNAEAYQRKCMSLNDFERWFEDNVSDVENDEEQERLRVAIDAAFAEYHFDHIGEDAFRGRLQEILRPFFCGTILISPIPKRTFSTATVVELRRPFPIPAPALAALAASIVFPAIADTQRAPDSISAAHPIPVAALQV